MAASIVRIKEGGATDCVAGQRYGVLDGAERWCEPGGGTDCPEREITGTEEAGHR